MRVLRRSHKWLFAGALLALVLPARAAEVDKFLPDDVDVVAVLNVKQILDSDLVKKHGLEKAKDLIKGNAEATKTLEALGFDPFKDLTSITIGSSGVGPLDSKGYVIIHGKFDAAKFEAKAEEVVKEMGEVVKIHKEGDHKIFEVNAPGQDKPMFVAVVSKETVAASTEKDFVIDSFARSTGKKKSTVRKEVQELIEKADGKQSMWAVFPGSLLEKAPIDDEKVKKSFEKVKDFALGITVGKDVKLGIAITAKTADGAKELAEDIKEKLNEAKGFLAVFAGMAKELAPVVDLVGSFKIGTEGSTVTVKGEVSEELIEKGLKKDQ